MLDPIALIAIGVCRHSDAKISVVDLIAVDFLAIDPNDKAIVGEKTEKKV